MIYIGNAFSLSMLAHPFHGRLGIREFSSAMEATGWLENMEEIDQEIISCVGHESTAAIFSGQLLRDVPPNRQNLTLSAGDALLVGQYSGPRLPEGATELPAGAVIRWFAVEIDNS